MILVVGATGNLGGEVTRTLLRQNAPVRILARPQSNYQLLVDAGAQVALADLKDRKSLDVACRDADVVITTANSASRGGDDNAQTVDWEGNCNLIDAAKAAGVKQFIFVSASVADPNSPNPILQAKGKAEAHLRSSGIPYTIIAPHFYMEISIAMLVGLPAMRAQSVTLVGEGRRKHSFISMGDVAAFILSSIDNPAAVNQRLLLAGPQPLSFRDAVAVYERVLARPITIKSVAPGEPVPGLPETALPMFAALDTFDWPVDTTETARNFGIPLTSLEEIVRRGMRQPIMA
jgi:NADH dehydrogenase